MSVVVGVDVGSGSARALALDREGTVLASAEERYAGQERWPAGEADPTAWNDALVAVLAGLKAELPEAGAPAAIGVGGQSPTTVVTDGRRALTCRHPAGAELDPVAQHRAQRLFLEQTEPYQLWDYLLTTLGAPRAQGRWPGDPPLEGYGELVETGSVVGVADGSGGVATGTPLVSGAQDAYLAFWAAGLDVPGRACDPGGRTGGLGVAVAARDCPEGMFAMTSAARGTSIVGGPVSAHGLSLEWLSRVSGRPVGELLDLAAGVPAGAGGLTFLPFLEGERAPRWNRRLRGELVGLASETGVAEVARAVLEGAAYGLAHVAAELAGDGVRFESVVCGGSPALSGLWCSIKASVLGVRVEVPAVVELAAYGAALAAGAGAGWWPAPGGAAAGAWPRPVVSIIEPVPEAAYVEGLARFVALGDRAERRAGVAGDGAGESDDRAGVEVVTRSPSVAGRGTQTRPPRDQVPSTRSRGSRPLTRLRPVSKCRHSTDSQSSRTCRSCLPEADANVRQAGTRRLTSRLCISCGE